MNLVTVILEYLLNHPQLQNQKDDEIFNQISLFYDFCNVDCVHRDMCMQLIRAFKGQDTNLISQITAMEDNNNYGKQ